MQSFNIFLILNTIFFALFVMFALIVAIKANKGMIPGVHNSLVVLMVSCFVISLGLYVIGLREMNSD